MKEIKTRVLLDPSGKIVSWGDDAWSCLDQVNITDEAEWDACIERGYRLCNLVPSAEPNQPIPFTSGVPTEDGWYVCNTVNGYEIVHKFVYVDINPDYVLSHAKLPEL